MEINWSYKMKNFWGFSNYETAKSQLKLVFSLLAAVK